VVFLPHPAIEPDPFFEVSQSRPYNSMPLQERIYLPVEGLLQNGIVFSRTSRISGLPRKYGWSYPLRVGSPFSLPHKIAALSCLTRPGSASGPFFANGLVSIPLEANRGLLPLCAESRFFLFGGGGNAFAVVLFSLYKSQSPFRTVREFGEGFLEDTFPYLYNPSDSDQAPFPDNY